MRKIAALLAVLVGVLFITVQCTANPPPKGQFCTPGYKHNCGLSLADFHKPIYSSSVTSAWYAETANPKGFSHISATINYTTAGEEMFSKTPVMLGTMLCDSSTGFAIQFGYEMNTNTGDYGAVFSQGYLPGDNCSAGGLLYEFPQNEKSLTKQVYNRAYVGLFLGAGDSIPAQAKELNIADFSQVKAQVGNQHYHGFNYWPDYEVNIYVKGMEPFIPTRLLPKTKIQPAKFSVNGN